jgi:hypothetical protein
MSLPRLDISTRIADRLNELAAVVKTRSRAGLTDANRTLESIATRFFNGLYGWNLVNLNVLQANYPAADLGDRARRIAIQVTNEDGADKIARTAAKAVEHGLGADFDRLVVFFLLPRKPGLPKGFRQPDGGPRIETWDLADILKQVHDHPDLDALNRAVKVLDEELAPATDATGGPQTRIHGDVHGPVLSGNFNGPVNVGAAGPTMVFRKKVNRSVFNFGGQQGVVSTGDNASITQGSMPNESEPDDE